MGQIGYVGQEPVLFAGTIGLNIANGKEGSATQEESEKSRHLHSCFTIVIRSDNLRVIEGCCSGTLLALSSMGSQLPPTSYTSQLPNVAYDG